MRIIISLKSILFVLGLVGLLFVAYSYGPSWISADNQNIEHSSQLTQLTPLDQNQAGKEAKPWQKRCAITKEGKTLCEVFMRLVMSNSNQRLLELVMSPLTKDKISNALVILPHGILVSQGGMLQIDDDKNGRQFKIYTCVETGCIAKFPMPQNYINQLKAAKFLNLSFANAQGKILRVQIPMAGFSETFDQL